MSEQQPSTWAILPAIDLRGGRVVRLRQGDFGREDVFGDDPAAIAKTFADAGATWIHIVDLDGAREGGRRQADVIAAIVETIRHLASPPRLQVAGGLRTRDALDEVIARGVERVVLGTAALTSPELVEAAIDTHGAHRIAVALDVRDGLAVGDGWVPGAPGVPAIEALTMLAALGVETFVVTAIARDGLLGGPDLRLLRECLDATRETSGRIIASGGITTPDDLRRVRALGCSGAIIGRAIYDGTLDLRAVLADVGSR